MSKTIVISGASRGIGKAIALKYAKDGANIVILAKTTSPHPKLPGTIYTAAKEIEEAGGKALPISCDIRNEGDIDYAIEKVVSSFGSKIDILINNASAISLTRVEDTVSKKLDLMHQVNARGSFLLTKKALPYLKLGTNPHVLFLSPPLIMKGEWLNGNIAYAVSKMTMSMWVLGMSKEFASLGIAVNALWPKTLIATSALQAISDLDEMSKRGRKVDIVADAAYIITSQPSGVYTGNFCIDEEIIKMNNPMADLSQYSIDPNSDLQNDFFIDPEYKTPTIIKSKL